MKEFINQLINELEELKRRQASIPNLSPQAAESQRTITGIVERLTGVLRPLSGVVTSKIQTTLTALAKALPALQNGNTDEAKTYITTATEHITDFCTAINQPVKDMEGAYGSLMNTMQPLQAYHNLIRQELGACQRDLSAAHQKNNEARALVARLESMGPLGWPTLGAAKAQLQECQNKINEYNGRLNTLQMQLYGMENLMQTISILIDRVHHGEGRLSWVNDLSGSIKNHIQIALADITNRTTAITHIEAAIGELDGLSRGS